MSNTYNIEIPEETDYSTRFDCTEDSTGLPTDLTGYRAELHIRVNYNGYDQPDAALKYSSDTGENVVLGGATGTVDVYIPYTDTTNKQWTNGVYYLFLITPKGQRLPFMSGFVTIIPTTIRLSQTILADQSSLHPTRPADNNYGLGGIPAPAAP